MKSIAWVGLTMCCFILFEACTPPVFESQADTNSGYPSTWENTGNINASFISTMRSVGVNTNTGTPSFDVSFIASASNIDSLDWQFPGGEIVNSDSIDGVTETVRYSRYGRFDVGLKVFNLDDRDSRYLEDFIEIFYKDDLIFSGSDATSWTVTGTASTPTDFTSPTDPTTSQDYRFWTLVSYDKTHRVKATKDFRGLPPNNLILEFDYKLERVPVLYINNEFKTSATGSSIITPTQVNYVAPVNASTVSNTRVDSQATFPGSKRFSIEYNGIPLWIASRISEDYFEHVRIELPSLSDFQIGLVREAQPMLVKQIPMPMDASPADNPSITASTTVLTPSFDLDGDGIVNTSDNDMDGDGYLNATEDNFSGLKTDRAIVPKFIIEHVRYPYNLNIRNFTIRIKDEEL